MTHLYFLLILAFINLIIANRRIDKLEKTVSELRRIVDLNSNLD